jgi:hypothetical protein
VTLPISALAISLACPSAWLACGHNHVFEQLRVGRIERLRVNLDGGERAVAFGAVTLTAPPPLVASTVRAASCDCTCSICCCIRAACFMSFPMLDILGWDLRVEGENQARTSTIWPLKISNAF